MRNKLTRLIIVVCTLLLFGISTCYALNTGQYIFLPTIIDASLSKLGVISPNVNDPPYSHMYRGTPISPSPDETEAPAETSKPPMPTVCATVIYSATEPIMSTLTPEPNISGAPPDATAIPSEIKDLQPVFTPTPC